MMNGIGSSPGVPEKASGGSVVTAKEALKPDLVRNREEEKRCKRQRRLRRKTDFYIRQDEPFDLPTPDVKISDELILPREPIRPGRGKPHTCDELYQHGGITVYVCWRRPNGSNVEEYRKLLRSNPNAVKWGCAQHFAAPSTYVAKPLTSTAPRSD